MLFSPQCVFVQVKETSHISSQESIWHISVTCEIPVSLLWQKNSFLPSLILNLNEDFLICCVVVSGCSDHWSHNTIPALARTWEHENFRQKHRKPRLRLLHFLGLEINLFLAVMRFIFTKKMQQVSSNFCIILFSF